MHILIIINYLLNIRVFVVVYKSLHKGQRLLKHGEGVGDGTFSNDEEDISVFVPIDGYQFVY